MVYVPLPHSSPSFPRNHCTSFGAGRALSLCGFVFFVDKPSRPPKLQPPRSGSNKQPRKRRGKMPHLRQKRRFPHRVLTNGHGVRHPVHKGWWGYGLVFDRIYRVNRIEGRGKERGRRGGERGTPIVGKATLTLRQRSWRQLL